MGQGARKLEPGSQGGASQQKTREPGNPARCRGTRKPARARRQGARKLKPARGQEPRSQETGASNEPMGQGARRCRGARKPAMGQEPWS